MIPLKDDNPSHTIPFINILLIISNMSIFGWQILFVNQEASPLFLRLGFIPYEFSHFKDIGPPNLVPFPLTFFTSMFLHGGWLHLLGNMLYLWIFGDNVEDRLGHARYLLFYILCGISATFVHGFMNLDSQVPVVGASGAIAGVLGAYMVLFPGARVQTLLILFVFIRVVRIPAIILLGYWILIQILSATAGYGKISGGGIAWFAHIGGFAAGLVLVFAMKKRRGWK